MLKNFDRLCTAIFEQVEDEIEVQESSGNVAGTITAANGKVVNIEAGKLYTVFYKDNEGKELISQGNSTQIHEPDCITTNWTSAPRFFFDNQENGTNPEILNIWTDEEFMTLLIELK